MIKKAAISMTALVLCLGMFAAAPVSAQPTAAAARHSGGGEHQQKMKDMLKEMSQELKEMTTQMKRGALTSAQTTQLANRMERVSIMISRMSGFQDEMFKQMDEMKRDSSMKSPAK